MGFPNLVFGVLVEVSGEDEGGKVTYRGGEAEDEEAVF